MGSHCGTLFLTVAFFFTIFFSSSTLHFASATRPLHGGHRFKNQALHLESLQSGPVPPSDSSACSHIPGSGVCINGMNYAGTVVRPLPPATILDSVASETKKKDPSS